MSPNDAGNGLDEAALSKLSGSFKGELIRPGDAEYDEHRKIWNGSIDRHPALILRCTGEDDVIAAVGFARNAGVPVAVRGGGHSFPGHSTCDDGIVIDLSPMKEIEVDPDARTATVEAGCLLGEVDAATQEHGLATVAGFVNHTGVAGLTLGGGIGWLHRKYGLTVDQLISVDLVTAAGEQLTASESENPELFWGLRGAGSNFGIATKFVFRLHEVGPTVLAGPVIWPIEETGDLLRFHREFTAGAPDELTTILLTRKAPPAPFVPEKWHGKRVAIVATCWCGDIEEGEKALAPLKSFGSPIADACAPKPYVEYQQAFNGSFVHGWHFYFRACDVAELNDDIIDTMVDYGNRIESPLSSLALWQMGGAVSRIDESETAFAGRNAGFTFNISGNTETAEGWDAEREWVRSYWSALEPHHTSVYVNFLMDEGEERIREAYGPERYDRLKALKREYDPENLFRLNQNIPPA